MISCSGANKSLRNKHYNKKTEAETPKKNNTSLNKVNIPMKYNAFIKKWLGTPYKWGGMSIYGIDCSAFVYKYYQSVYNMTINRTTTKQYNQGRFIKKAFLRQGDLVFFKGTTNKTGITHVGVYLKDNQFVHASTSQGVTISNLNDAYYMKHYAGARRIIQ